MRRPFGVKWVLCFPLDKVFPSAESPLSPPCHPHSSISDFRGCKLGVLVSVGAATCLSTFCSILRNEKLGQAINPVTETRRLGFASPSGCFLLTLLSGSQTRRCSATVCTLLCCPINDAATLLTYAAMIRSMRQSAAARNGEFLQRWRWRQLAQYRHGHALTRVRRFSIGVIAGLANRLGLSLSGHSANGILRPCETDRSHRIDVD